MLWVNVRTPRLSIPAANLAVLWLMVLLMTRRRPQLFIPPVRADLLLLTVDESSVMIPMLLLWNPPPLILKCSH